MKVFKAVITEGNQIGQTIGNTKTRTYKGMNETQFISALKNATCFSFKVVKL